MNFEKLPENWKVVRLGRVAEKITDGTHRTPKYVEKGIPFISTANLVPYSHDFDFTNYKKFITSEEHEQLIKRAKPEKGDLLVSKCGTIGITQLVRTDMEFSIFVGLALIKLRKNIVLGEYLEFLFNWDYFRHLLESLSPGSNRKTLTINALTNLTILLPPLPEQKRIVEILNLAEDLIKKQKEAIALIDKILMAKFLEMFGAPATNPKGWEVIEFDEATLQEKREFKPKVGKIPQSEYLDNGKYPIIDQGEKFIAGFTNDDAKVYKGQLPVIIFGDHTCRFKYIDFPFVRGADGVKVLVPNVDRFHPKFLFYAFKLLKFPDKDVYKRHYSWLKRQNIICPP